MGADQEICGGVCVDTSKDLKHCGMCFNPCPEGELCEKGECVVILPYGAPMPEPLWA